MSKYLYQNKFYVIKYPNICHTMIILMSVYFSSILSKWEFAIELQGFQPIVKVVKRANASFFICQLHFPLNLQKHCCTNVTHNSNNNNISIATFGRAFVVQSQTRKFRMLPKAVTAKAKYKTFPMTGQKGQNGPIWWQNWTFWSF